MSVYQPAQRTAAQKVDHSALRANQATIILLAVLAFVLNTPWMAAAIALVMLFGSLALQKPGFFWIYKYGLRPLGLAHPDLLEDHPQPHLFAQGFGGTVLLAAALILWAGLSALGWALVWLVAALAALNLFAGFCVGCAIYYWFSRLNVPGFSQRPPEGVLPGARPQR